jgi:hypothetical protein
MLADKYKRALVDVGFEFSSRAASNRREMAELTQGTDRPSSQEDSPQPEIVSRFVDAICRLLYELPLLS